MLYTIQYSPEASNDLTDILGFYKAQSSPDLQKTIHPSVIKCSKNDSEKS